MEILEAVLILLGFVLISDIISHYLTIIPVSLIQIGLGVVIALFFHFKIELDTSWFLLLFIAPLLFNDGRDFPKKELWELKGPIFENAILLVFLTTILGGFFVNWLIPSMPLAACFALIAILSPTDPVAVQSISKRAHLPAPILHLVSGESLINDASGLIAFKYAIAAVVTGYFSLTKAAGDFLYMSVMGFIVGLVLIKALGFLRNWLYRIEFHDAIFTVVLQVLTPFAIYVVSEDLLHASGVIAVVTAGILENISEKTVRGQTPEIVLITNRTWDIIVYCLNGIIFLILGIELPVAMKSVIKGSKYSTLESFGYAVAIWFMILVIRVLWIYGYSLFNYYFSKKEQKKPKFGVALLAGLSGVRGAITMVGVLSVPLFLADGKPFPDRSLMLFVAACVIIISLVVAAITLPIISPGGVLETRAFHVDDDEETATEDKNNNSQTNYVSPDVAHMYMLNSAVAFLENNKTEQNQRAVYAILMDYEIAIRKQQQHMHNQTEMNHSMQELLALNRIALNGFRDELNRLYKEKKIGKDSYWIASRKLNHKEYQLAQVNGDSQTQHLMPHSGIIGKLIRAFKIWQWNEPENSKTQQNLRLIQEKGSEAAIRSIKDFLNRDEIDKTSISSQVIHFLLVYYEQQIQQAQSYGNTEKENAEYEKQFVNLKIRALEAERKAVDTLTSDGNISAASGLKLRQNVNYEETILLNDYKRGNE